VLGAFVTGRGGGVVVTLGKSGTNVGIGVGSAVTSMVAEYPHSGVAQAESKISTADEMKIRNGFIDKAALQWFSPPFRPASLLLRVSGEWHCS
jgi:hypothetical protein